jgi:hypothetical protein
MINLGISRDHIPTNSARSATIPVASHTSTENHFGWHLVFSHRRFTISWRQYRKFSGSNKRTVRINEFTQTVFITQPPMQIVHLHRQVTITTACVNTIYTGVCRNVIACVNVSFYTSGLYRRPPVLIDLHRRPSL